MFGRDWKADAERRDFTINALSATADGTVHDYVGGLADIAARRVRFIGEPQRRIEEDYLRILRFFRFHAHFGEGAPDAAGVHACIVARAGLETLSRERVRMELLKLLVAARATPTLAVMAECGLLGMVLGGVAYLASFENMIKVEAALGAEADAVRRLGALGVWVEEDAERLSQRLRLSNAESERLLALEGWWRVAPKPIRRRRARCFIGSGRNRSPIGCLWPGRARKRARPTAPGTRLRACRNAGRRRYFRSRPRTSCGAASRRVRRSARRLRAAEAAWIAADFPADDAAIEADRRSCVLRVRTSVRAIERSRPGVRTARKLAAARAIQAAAAPAPSCRAAAGARPAFHCRARRSRRPAAR